MSIKYAPLMKRLWELTGEIGHMAEAEPDQRYLEVYALLSKALDEAEAMGLIEYEEEG